MPGRISNPHNALPSGSVSDRNSLAGKIMWLETKQQLEKSGIVTRFDEGVYDHPAVILSRARGTDGTVVILILTSFSNTDLSVKHANNEERRRRYIPIHPAPAHPDTGERLHLKKGRQLRKNSYINVADKYTVVFEALRPYLGPSKKLYVLTNESYQRLVTAAGFVAGPELPSQRASRPETATQQVSSVTTSPSPAAFWDSMPASTRPGPAQRPYEPSTPLFPSASTQERMYGHMQAQQTSYGGTATSARRAATNHPNFNHVPTHSSSLISGFPFPSNTRRPATLPLHRSRSDVQRRQREEEKRLLLIVVGALLASIAVWKMWEYRVETLVMMRHGIRWLSEKGFELLKGGLRLVYRGLTWGVVKGAKLIKTFAVMGWNWVAAGSDL